MTRTALGFLTLTLGAAIACSAAGTQSDTSGQGFFWIAHNAVYVDGPHAREGVTEVSFQLRQADRSDVTPSDLTFALNSHYERLGFRPRSIPGSSAAIQQWVEFNGGGVLSLGDRGEPIRQTSRYWVSEWENDNGDVVRYNLSQLTIDGSNESYFSAFGTYRPRP